MELDIHFLWPKRKDFRIGMLYSRGAYSDSQLVAYTQAGFRLEAIASEDLSRARKAAEHFKIPRVYGSAAQLLEDSSIEVLVLAETAIAQPDLIKEAAARKTAK